MLADREWDVLVDMVVTAGRGGRRARRELDRFYDRRDVVDFVEVVSYACALLVECMRLPDGTFPAESEVRRLGVQLYPAWRRTTRDQPPATLLNILMSMMGYDEMQATGLATCTQIVVAIAVLLPAEVDTRVAVAEKRDMVERVNAIRQAEREAEAVTDRPDERDG